MMTGTSSRAGRPDPGRRLVAGLLAGLFLLAGAADVYGLHRCPHHEPAGGPEAPSEQLLCASPPPLPHLHPATDGAPEEDAGPCTCVGSCHGSATTPAVSDRPTPLAERPALAARRVAPPLEDAPSTDPSAHLVPYPNGPPLSG